MDDPFVGPNTPAQLRRACERNRLEKQFLINAYECLVALIASDEPRSAKDDSVVREEEPNLEHAGAREACGIGHG